MRRWRSSAPLVAVTSRLGSIVKDRGCKSLSSPRAAASGVEETRGARSQSVRSVFYLVVFTILMLPTLFLPVYAVTPDEMLQDSNLEARARSISQGLRCVVCQNQSIDDSNAPLAHDLRVLLRERLVSGDSDQQSIDYIAARYGNFVLLKPPEQPNTLFLWAGPALFFLIAALGFRRYTRIRAANRSFEDMPQFSSAEQERLDALLNKRGSE
jgi:cytochrome c-type biogenesis protein CcmH